MTSAHSENGRGCVEFSVIGQPTDQAALRREFMEISRRMQVDIAFQKDTISAATGV